MNDQDTTTERFALEALRESEERFRATFENAAVGIAHVAPNGTFLRVNDRLARILGYTLAELAAKTFQVITHPDDLQADLTLLAQVLSGEIDTFNMEKRYFRKDGQIVWANLTVGCVRRADRGVDYLISVVEDITTRKRAEDELRRSHDTYLSLIEKNPFGIYLVDSEFRLAQLGAGARKVFEGVSPLLGRDFAEVLRTVWAEPFATDAINHFRHTLATGEPYVAVTDEQRGNADVVESYDWRIERVTLPNGRFGVVCYFYDLTERQRYEERVQLLMREVNHRSKNMLALVQSIARLTAAGTPENFARRFEERIVALAASQDLLIRGDWSGAEINELIRSQLAHFSD
ncbi:MAG TPA: PAS domain S-box protein, partial [Micropepsaceae bacterium]|nr:PAS domain S-box protein [Micropepsaceae bacterium]